VADVISYSVSGSDVLDLDDSGNLTISGALTGATGATVTAANVSVADAASSLVGTTVEAALAEIATPLTLTAAAESSDVIAVTVAGPAHAAQYVATLYDADMLLSLVGAFTMAETGAGAEVSTTAKPRLLFTTSAAGAATLSVTDVATGSGATVYLEVRPACASAGLGAGQAAVVALTFD
jgi:hypothetical protein